MMGVRKVLKNGLCLGLSLTLMLAGTSCGKDKTAVDDYGVESDTVSGDVASVNEPEAESYSEAINSDRRSLTEVFGENISADDSFTIGGVTAEFNLNYKVPEVTSINVYEGSLFDNNSDIEKQVVNSFFGGTEKELEEIKYVNDSDYIPLLYKYRSILMFQALGTMSYSSTSISQEDAAEYLSSIDSSFDKVYKWVDEANYYIHMYEGEYNGNRYGMIYSYDTANSQRNIFICPISVSEYFPEVDAKTMFVVDQQSDFGSENLCSMSEADIMNEAGIVLEKLGLSEDDICLTANPNMSIPEMGLLNTFGGEETITDMPKLVFVDSNLMSAAEKLNISNPTGRTYAYKILKEQQNIRGGQENSEDVNFSVNGYALYLCSEPFSDKVTPQPLSSFNRGSIFYTDKGLYSVDISLVAEIDNVVEGVKLLSFDNIKEGFKEAVGNDPDLSQRDSASLEVADVNFTYVLVEDKENNDKVAYVPAWYFVTKDNKLKSGDQPLTYSHVINAIDGSDLKDTVR